MMLFYNVKRKLYYLLLLFPLLSFSQSVLKGVISNAGDKEGIHVFNKTFHKYTITDAEGKFEIAVQVNDTITFSGIQYELKTHIIKKEDINKSFLKVTLNTKINKLDAVYLGYQLVGNLGIDAKYIKTDVPMEIALTNSFRGLGKHKGLLPIDGQSAIGKNVIPQGGNMLGLIGMIMPKNNEIIMPKIVPLLYSRDALVIYYGGDFFKGHLKIKKVDEERFIHFTEFDSIIVVSLKERNKLGLLHRILQLREQFEISE